MKIEMSVTHFDNSDVLTTSYDLFYNGSGNTPNIFFDSDYQNSASGSQELADLMNQHLKELGWSNGTEGTFHYSSSTHSWSFTKKS